jgi:hypothetical protein
MVKIASVLAKWVSLVLIAVKYVIAVDKSAHLTIMD